MNNVAFLCVENEISVGHKVRKVQEISDLLVAKGYKVRVFNGTKIHKNAKYAQAWENGKILQSLALCDIAVIIDDVGLCKFLNYLDITCFYNPYEVPDLNEKW